MSDNSESKKSSDFIFIDGMPDADMVPNMEAFASTSEEEVKAILENTNIKLVGKLNGSSK